MLFDGYLVDLQGHRFLDMTLKGWVADARSFPLSIESGKSGSRLTPSLIHTGIGSYIEFWPTGTATVEMRMRVAHWFFRLTKNGKNLNLAYIDERNALAQKTAEISHTMVGEPPAPGETDNRQLLLTAASADLQKFIVDHVKDKQMFADEGNFTRSGQ